MGPEVEPNSPKTGLFQNRPLYLSAVLKVVISCYYYHYYYRREFRPWNQSRVLRPFMVKARGSLIFPNRRRTGMGMFYVFPGSHFDHRRLKGFRPTMGTRASVFGPMGKHVGVGQDRGTPPKNQQKPSGSKSAGNTWACVKSGRVSNRGTLKCTTFDSP